MDYTRLLGLAEKEDIEVIEIKLSGKTKGLYADNVIGLSKDIDTTVEKTCILAEELGHYYTSFGDITDQSRIECRKQERRARAWGYESLVSMASLIKASEQGIRSRYELAEYLNVTEDFISEALNYYREKYGLCCKKNRYTVYFDPLWIYKDL